MYVNNIISENNNPKFIKKSNINDVQPVLQNKNSFISTTQNNLFDIAVKKDDIAITNPNPQLNKPKLNSTYNLPNLEFTKN